MECRTKRCRRCFEVKPETAFHIAHGETRRAVCADCRNERMRLRYPAIRERKQRAGKAWYERNRLARIKQVAERRRLRAEGDDADDAADHDAGDERSHET